MQIEIDFEVFKALTALRQSEADSYNAVLRRLLNLRSSEMANALAAFSKAADPSIPSAFEAIEKFGTIKGAWFSNVHFPENTQFRATYKGQTFLAEIKQGQWVGQDGIVRTSPSEAAGAISGTNVNGWRFWLAKRPGDPSWKRMDEFKK